MGNIHPKFLDQVKVLLWRAKNTPGFKMRFSAEELEAASNLTMRVYAGYDAFGIQDSFTFSVEKIKAQAEMPRNELETEI